MDEREVTLPFTSTELSVRQVSSSFLLLQTFGAHILWGLETPTTYITLQPVFANKVIPVPGCATLLPGGRSRLGCSCGVQGGPS